MVSAISGVLVHDNDLGDVNRWEIGWVEGGLLGHQLLHVGFLQDSPADRRAVAALVAGEVLDIEDGGRVRGGDHGLDERGGGAEAPVVEGVWDGVAVLWRGAGPRDLPRLLDVFPQRLEQVLQGGH